MSSISHPADTLLEDPGYARLKQHLIESTGLTYYSDKDADFARRIGRRLLELNVGDCSSYFDVLRDPQRGPAEVDALIAEITIGESYFFRHREHFEALRDLVLPDLIMRNSGSKRLRIWCAGCADGAEPYSLSILLKREMGHALAGWEVAIFGTDINRHGLAAARLGRYEEWSLRATPADLKRDCFSKDGKYWTIAPEYRCGVSFEYYNLAAQSFPAMMSPPGALDLIICRNVMIYFDLDLMRKTVQQFHDCLSTGAWLLVGPAEPNMTHFTAFRIVNAPGVTLYQKQAAETATLKPATFGPAPTSIAATSVAAIPFVSAAEVREAAPIRASERVHPSLTDVRRYADYGEWEQAATCCEELLEKENLNSSAYLFQGLVLRQLNRLADAERSLRRAIYLNRQSALAHYHLGLLLRSRGDSRKARRAFENTLELLSSRADDEILSDADGITIIELKKWAKMHIENLGEEV